MAPVPGSWPPASGKPGPGLGLTTPLLQQRDPSRGQLLRFHCLRRT